MKTKLLISLAAVAAGIVVGCALEWNGRWVAIPIALLTGGAVAIIVFGSEWIFMRFE